MSMTERSFAYENTQSYELRKLQVLDGSAARARADAKRIDAVKLAIGVIAVLVYFLSLAFMEAKITTAGAQLNELQATIAETDNNTKIIDLQIGSLASLSRVEQYAQEHLGMVYPEADTIYFLDKESSLNIALGHAKLENVVAETSPAAEETHPLWEAARTALNNFFGATALAAE